MKRSEINAAIDYALAAMREIKLPLSDFAFWNRADWNRQGENLLNLRGIGLGWDVTDFGSGDFSATGSVLFTLRNGCYGRPELGTPYAEKLIFQRQEREQEIPFHFHITKTEDIINRGGGVLMLELYNSTADTAPDKTAPVRVRMDGVLHTFAPGEPIAVTPGNSITLTPGLFHRFYAKYGGGDLICGEVSSINDDRSDNVFLAPGRRFAQIEEDEPARYLLCNEI